MAVATIQAQKTVKAREAALATLASVIRDPITRARMRADLKPLTQFGSKADADVARQSGWATFVNQDGDSAALGLMIVAPDCRWQVVRATGDQEGCVSASAPVGVAAFAAAVRPFRLVAERCR